MNALLIYNIQSLYGIVEEPGILKKSGAEMNRFDALHQAWILIEEGVIKDYGTMDHMPAVGGSCERLDASKRMVLPSFVDSHTHLVYAKSREEEFEMRIRGKSYEEIAAAGGGILNSAKKLQAMSEDDLYDQALERLHEVIATGTGAIEIKSGYGLTVEDELKMLRVIRRLKAVSPITIKATFLGAHAIPGEYKENRNAYIDLVIQEMLPRIATEKLADYCDVFCDQGFFTVEETDRILKAASALGLKAKIHGNELGYTGGVQVAVKNKALSVDHLEYTGDEEISALLNSETMPVGLPNCSFFLGIPYAPGRKMIDAGLPFCLATDFNPGSSPNGRMSFILSLACIHMKLTPEEAFNAATINGAFALELSATHGSITRGKQANLILTKPIPSLAYIPYRFGIDLIEKVIVKGKCWN
ncbi:MAG: imidazolonepropionase [Bacteroidia bacterium]|jgi:imidazolonepropionase